MTGGTASGKSSICKRLEGLGAKIVDCDKLGHQAYVKGTAVLDQIVQTFGADVLTADGEIDRRALGAKVFSAKVSEINSTDLQYINFGADLLHINCSTKQQVINFLLGFQEELEKLNNIVWPAIASLAKKQIEDFKNQGMQSVNEILGI